MQRPCLSTTRECRRPVGAPQLDYSGRRRLIFGRELRSSAFPRRCVDCELQAVLAGPFLTISIPIDPSLSADCIKAHPDDLRAADQALGPASSAATATATAEPGRDRCPEVQYVEDSHRLIHLSSASPRADERPPRFNIDASGSRSRCQKMVSLIRAGVVAAEGDRHIRPATPSLATPSCVVASAPDTCAPLACDVA